MMTRPEPSPDGILIGLACLILCDGFSAMPGAQSAAPPAPAQGQGPPPEAPDTPLVTGAQPHRLLLMEVSEGRLTATGSGDAPRRPAAVAATLNMSDPSG
ncbi:hypothetical protein [Methylobacterium sp. CM6257]